jgi:hypothetical protein
VCVSLFFFFSVKFTETIKNYSIYEVIMEMEMENNYPFPLPAYKSAN